MLALHDQVRDRTLPTDLHLPRRGANAPVIVFGHGAWGHPRKFTRLFAEWADAGYAVAAPLFPRTNDQSRPHVIEDVVNQPADSSFVIDELWSRGIGRGGRVGVGGFSLARKRPSQSGCIRRLRKDPKVRPEDALRTYEAAHDPKSFVTINGAGHGICENEHPTADVRQTAEVTTRFWNEHLGRGAGRPGSSSSG